MMLLNWDTEFICHLIWKTHQWHEIGKVQFSLTSKEDNAKEFSNKYALLFLPHPTWVKLKIFQQYLNQEHQDVKARFGNNR